jgi:hypothetical protein
MDPDARASALGVVNKLLNLRKFEIFRDPVVS